MILYIRERFGDYFCIGVVGFPDASEKHLQHLKEKIDCGANFVITQAVFEAETFLNFQRSCEKLLAHTNVPIIPGIYLFETARQLKGFSEKCKVKVSDEVLTLAEGVDFSSSNMIANLIHDISRDGMNVHFFTMNRLKFLSDFIEENGL